MLESLITLLLLSGQNAQEAKDPTPLTPPSTWISEADYPKELRDVQGRTVAVLTIDAQGQVAACEIRGSSGSAILDETACRRARERGRFIPARDSRGVAITGSYLVPVLWGKPAIDIQPFSSHLVATMKNGRMVSCIRSNSDEPMAVDTHARCNISTDLLLRYFGRDYVFADQVTIETMTLSGNGPVPRGPAEGRRVILKESAVAIGPDGRAVTCQSRIPSDGGKESLADCLGFPADRMFTGLRTFVSVIDWTLRYPATYRGGGDTILN
ncbi:MAG: hypothetical protein JWN66_1158 [Sphingomonas bacterium]|uniref:energy transducer TonB n=1 Tax=Sphingomonas bacterium TaxID=1895847 RepID=UPI00261D1AEC|nr:energy transducer TonB [Sphingomonas bacterium]MDB5704042.1 hypothetical protein [Sphingomonas bacterium]